MIAIRPILLALCFTLVRPSTSGEARFDDTILIGATISVLLLGLVLRSTETGGRLWAVIGRVFRPNHDGRRVVQSFVATMTRAEARLRPEEWVLSALAEAVDGDAGAIWVLNPSIGVFVPMALSGMVEPLPRIPADADLPRFLARTGTVVNVAECVWEPASHAGLVLPPWIGGLGEGWVVVPLIHRGEIEGFAVLGLAPSRPIDPHSETVDLLTALGTLAALYLAEARVTRALSDSQGLSDYNHRFAFVVHDVKNLLGQMSLLLQNAERFGDDPLFQRDMLVTIGASVVRLREMQTRLDRRVRPRTHRFNLAVAAAAAVGRWRWGGRVEFRGGDALVMVQGQADRLASVLDHLIDNGLEAAAPDGSVLVEVTPDGIVTITDDGPGMSAEFIRDRLFRPLQTSKPHGSGIGAYQALQMVREMNGRLDVESETGRGTTLRISLPLAPIPARREPHPKMSLGLPALIRRARKDAAVTVP
jgi:putative PEP-CTERM system histidine kinase